MLLFSPNLIFRGNSNRFATEKQNAHLICVSLKIAAKTTCFVFFLVSNSQCFFSTFLKTNYKAKESLLPHMSLLTTHCRKNEGESTFNLSKSNPRVFRNTRFKFHSLGKLMWKIQNSKLTSSIFRITQDFVSS